MPGQAIAPTVTTQRRPSTAATVTCWSGASTSSGEGSTRSTFAPAQAGLGAHGELGDLPGLRPRRPPAAQPRLDLADGRSLERGDGTRDVEPSVEVAGGQDQGGRGEAVAAEVGGLPDLGLTGGRDRPRQRAAVDRAAAILTAVRADQQHRLAHGLAGQRLVHSGKGHRGELGGVDDPQHGRPRSRGSGVGEEDPRRAVRRAATRPADEHRTPACATGASDECSHGVVAVLTDLVRPGAAVLDPHPARGDGGGAGEGLVEGAGQRRAPRARSIRSHHGSLAEALLTRADDSRAFELRRRGEVQGNNGHDTLPQHIAFV